MRPLEVSEPVESSEEELPELSDDEVSDEDCVPPLLPLLLVLELVPLLAVVPASACIVPTRANTPAAAASVIAAATAAVRCAPLRTAAAAPCSLGLMTVPPP
ncbi:hypothetical protein ACFYWX_11195 [Streptomyces sp. NPDC002888]|uniref:hypothetical protein n=1 Tax=Streptomyces sp. NPDC002888 TaxID=3364668 RepID=UPI00369C7FCB